MKSPVYKPHGAKRPNPVTEQQPNSFDLMVSLWTRLLALYGRQGEKEYGITGGETFLQWTVALKDYPASRIKHALEAVMAEGTEYPPSLIKFLRLVRASPDPTKPKLLDKPKPRYSVRRIEVLKIEFLTGKPVTIPRLRDEHMIRDWTAEDEAILLDAMSQFQPDTPLEDINNVIDRIEFSGGTQQENAHVI